MSANAAELSQMNDKNNPSCDCGKNEWWVYYVESGGLLLNQKQIEELSGWERKCLACGEVQKGAKTDD